MGREESLVRGIDHFGRFRTDEISPEGGRDETVVSSDRYDSCVSRSGKVPNRPIHQDHCTSTSILEVGKGGRTGSTPPYPR